MTYKGWYTIKPNQPITFSLKSDQINLLTNIWPNRLKNYKKKKCPKTHIEDKTNLTFLGIK